MILQKIDPHVFAFAAFFIALTGCTSITNRSYSKPFAYIKFAAMEACLTAGCELVPSPMSEGPMQIKATRGLMIGLFSGQGGETIQIDLTNSGNTTEVMITSRKRAFGFLAQRHADVRVAAFLDKYLRENGSFDSMIIKSINGAQR